MCVDYVFPRQNVQAAVQSCLFKNNQQLLFNNIFVRFLSFAISWLVQCQMFPSLNCKLNDHSTKYWLPLMSLDWLAKCSKKTLTILICPYRVALTPRPFTFWCETSYTIMVHGVFPKINEFMTQVDLRDVHLLPNSFVRFLQQNSVTFETSVYFWEWDLTPDYLDTGRARIESFYFFRPCTWNWINRQTWMY